MKAIRLALVAFAVLAFLLSPAPSRASATVMNQLTFSFKDPGPGSFNDNLTGVLELWTTDSAGNFVALVPAVQLPALGPNGQMTVTLDTVGTAACWISIAGDVTLNGVQFPMFAFSSDSTTWRSPGPAGAPPIISVGMLNGASFETASGALVGFDGAVQVGSWTFTETATPEPGTLALMGLGLAFMFGTFYKFRSA